MAVVIAAVIVTSTTKRTNDGIHDHEHDPIIAGSCVGEHKYGRHGGLAMACAGVVVAAPEEVAAIIITQRTCASGNSMDSKYYSGSG